MDSRERAAPGLVGAPVIVDLSALPGEARMAAFRLLLPLPVTIWLYELRGK